MGDGRFSKLGRIFASVVSTYYRDWWRLYTLTDAIEQEKPEPEPASVR
ncbi:hypothetical protein [Thermocoleostomius sinensis]|uniref:Uncharacterized protein n=1 Tax=Thermocoleostomius sinensis A174 TaxID=2016057 RepID=A0A9E8ZB45_9CYAN|nr:hypothetical protein [Thermocoleostomius sinensis]WAL58724.1 hypothetical protein OXH18_16270 [Thermocoleostomius sinensis A174]